jgi:hypothetical protein
MSKDININHTFVKTPVRITVDGVTYPLNGHNIEIVRKYWDTEDEKVLDKLVDFSFRI